MGGKQRYLFLLGFRSPFRDPEILPRPFAAACEVSGVVFQRSPPRAALAWGRRE